MNLAHELLDTKGKYRIPYYDPLHARPRSATWVDTANGDVVRAQEAKHSELLQLDDVAQLAMHLFDGEEGEINLRTIVSQLTPVPYTKIGLRCGSLEVGDKAHHILYEAKIDGQEEPVSFVAYFSRGARGAKDGYAVGLAEETDRDYENLQRLGTLFEEKLKPEARAQYGVLKPIASGDALAETGELYPWYITPFIPRGELSLEVAINGDTVPYVSYASPYNDEMRRIIKAQEQFAYDTARRGKLVRELNETKEYKGQRRELFTLLSLVWELSKNFTNDLTRGVIPSELYFNAGDVMGNIVGIDYALHNLILITVRGGFTDPLTMGEFFERMQNNKEIYVLITGGEMRIPYFQKMETNEMQECLDHAQRMMQ